MLRIMALAALTAMPAAAQTNMVHEGMNMTPNMTLAKSGPGPQGAPVTEPGQGAFAAIAEIVRTLEANPQTDWSSVNIPALREHLRDMNKVTIDAVATAKDTAMGEIFTITGAPDVFPSIQRMVSAHAKVMEGVNDWQYSVRMLPNGAEMTVTVPRYDMAKLKGLGFFGVLAAGMHHQAHHWMMATGANPHS